MPAAQESEDFGVLSQNMGKMAGFPNGARPVRRLPGSVRRLRCNNPKILEFLAKTAGKWRVFSLGATGQETAWLSATPAAQESENFGVLSKNVGKMTGSRTMRGWPKGYRARGDECGTFGMASGSLETVNYLFPIMLDQED